MPQIYKSDRHLALDNHKTMEHFRTRRVNQKKLAPRYTQGRKPRLEERSVFTPLIATSLAIILFSLHPNYLTGPFMVLVAFLAIKAAFYGDEA